MRFKRQVIVALTAGVLAGWGAVGPARAATVAVDQSNASIQNNFCYTTPGNLCGQSFQQSAGTLAGAGVYVGEYINSQFGAVTLSVYGTYGRTPGGLVATGTQNATQSGWVDVFWDAVSITPGQTYYLVASSPQTNVLTYGIGNGYAGGQSVYAGTTGVYRGYRLANYDLTFRTFAAVPEVVVTPPSNLPAAVPLPASLTLLLGALGGLSILQWRRRTV